MSGTRRLLCSRRMEEKGSTAMKLKNHRRTGAFTLVEIMIVVAIIGLLAAIAIPNFVKARETSQQNACVNNLRQIDAAKDQWALENGKATETPINDAAKGEVIKYLRREPKCPVGDAPYNYTKVGDPALCTSTKASDHNRAYQGTSSTASAGAGGDDE
jgi:prepilin-type N-terminal cleavage/methylation domain-containing protein